MGFANRYKALVYSHRSIDEKIETEMKRPNPDSLALQRLKRRKLLLKDEIEAWERLMGAVGVSADTNLDVTATSEAVGARRARSGHIRGGRQLAQSGQRLN